MGCEIDWGTVIKTVTEPGTVHRFLDRLKAIPLLFGRAQIAAGVDVLCLADHATGDLVRGTVYRDFLIPIHQQMVAELGCPIVAHLWEYARSHRLYRRGRL